LVSVIIVYLLLHTKYRGEKNQTVIPKLLVEL
jgi:hypothetical protein